MGEVDEPAFSGLAERHRRELHVHCYRMLGSFEDAEDAVQETFLRAWRRRETFEGRSTLRAWLYRMSLTAISLVPPLLSAANTATIVALIVLHLVAATMMIPALARSLRIATRNARV